MIKQLVTKLYEKVCGPIVRPVYNTPMIDRTELTQLRSRVCYPYQPGVLVCDQVKHMKREAAMVIASELVERDCFEVIDNPQYAEVTVHCRAWIKE